jgi:hypothetical protein
MESDLAIVYNSSTVLWGKQLSGENILFYCANIATVQIIKNGRSKEPLINEIYETSDCVLC